METSRAPRSEEAGAERLEGLSRELLWREAVGHVIRAERLARFLTQARLAARAGISVQYLSEIERGRKEPSSEILAALARALELRLHDLATGVARVVAPAQVLDLATGEDRRDSATSGRLAERYRGPSLGHPQLGLLRAA